MNRMKRLSAALLLAALPAAFAQQTRTTVIYTSGEGTSTNTDRGQATSDATDTATNWANTNCIGNVTETNISFSQCTPLGSSTDPNVQYMCSVTVKARCEIQSRSR